MRRFLISLAVSDSYRARDVEIDSRSAKVSRIASEIKRMIEKR